jgi:CP family cyanate transporter-like MFS transporter
MGAGSRGRRFDRAGYLGLAVAPAAAPLAWMTALGLGQGIAISLALSYIVWRSPDPQHTGHLSTMAQGSGYLLAGVGPIGLGFLHSLSHGWTVPLAALGILLVGQLVAGIIAAKDRFILSN